MYPLELCAPRGNRPIVRGATGQAMSADRTRVMIFPSLGLFWKPAEQLGRTAMQRNDQDDMSFRHRRRRRRFEIVLLVPALLAFGGCMVGPDFQQPKATVSPAGWRPE